MVSVIITTHKREPNILKRAALSVLNQTYKDLELIIVDDSPADYDLRTSVKEMVEELDGNITYVAHEKNMGACAARNTGLKSARGEFVAFLDDDDEWLPEKIEKQIEVIRKNDKVALVYCGRYTYCAKTGETYLQKTKFLRGRVFDKLIYRNFIGSTSFPLLRKSAVDKVGGFDEQMPAAQDYELWLRISKEYEIDYVKEPLVRYYVHEGERITRDYRRKFMAHEKLIEKYKDYLQFHPKIKSSFYMPYAYWLIEFDREKAKKMFWKAFAFYPIPTFATLRTIKWLYVVPIMKKLWRR